MSVLQRYPERKRNYIVKILPIELKKNSWSFLYSVKKMLQINDVNIFIWHDILTPYLTW